MSADGKALFVSGSDFDHAEKLVVDNNSIMDLDMKEFMHLLSTMINLPTQYQNTAQTSFEALACVILHKYLDNNQNRPEARAEAVSWLCWALCTKASSLLISKRVALLLKMDRRHKYPKMQNDIFVHKTCRKYRPALKEIEQLMSGFEELKARFANVPWPQEFSLRSLDKNLCIRMFYRINRLEEQETAQVKDKSEKLTDLELKAMTEAFEAGELGPKLAEPLNSAEMKLAVPSALKLFITRSGRFGLGPPWLAKNDAIMLVHGVSVPYVFSDALRDFGREEHALRKALDDTEMDYSKQLRKIPDKQNPVLHPKSEVDRRVQEKRAHSILDRRKFLQKRMTDLMHDAPFPDALVLVGEAYIEGIMHGETPVQYSERTIAIV